MRSLTKKIGRPTTDNELGSDSVWNQGEGDKELNDIVQKISLDKISLDKRREKANKPLYLVRYE